MGMYCQIRILTDSQYLSYHSRPRPGHVTWHQILMSHEIGVACINWALDAKDIKRSSSTVSFLYRNPPAFSNEYFYIFTVWQFLVSSTYCKFNVIF